MLRGQSVYHSGSFEPNRILSTVAVGCQCSPNSGGILGRSGVESALRHADWPSTATTCQEQLQSQVDRASLSYEVVH